VITKEELKKRERVCAAKHEAVSQIQDLLESAAKGVYPNKYDESEREEFINDVLLLLNEDD